MYKSGGPADYTPNPLIKLIKDSNKGGGLMRKQVMNNLSELSLLRLSRAIRRIALARSNPPMKIGDTATDRCQDEAYCGGYNEAFVLQFWANYNPRY